MRRILHWAFVALVLALMCLNPHPARAASAVVTCNPVSATGYTTENLSVDIVINDITGLNAADIIGTFDPTIAQVVDANPGKTGVQIQPLNTFMQPDFVVRDVADNAAGTYNYAATQVAPNAPVTGSGAVFRVTFHPLTFGTFTINFTKHDIVDVDGLQIPHTVQSCTVRFNSPLAVDLGEVQARREGNSVLLAWETVSESANVGFNIYRAASVNAPRARVAFVPSSAPGSTAGQTYAYRAETGPESAVYWLEDVSLTGAATLHGPYFVPESLPTAAHMSRFAASSVTLPLASAVLIFGLGAFGLCALLKPRGATRR